MSGMLQGLRIWAKTRDLGIVARIQGWLYRSRGVDLTRCSAEVGKASRRRKTLHGLATGMSLGARLRVLDGPAI